MTAAASMGRRFGAACIDGCAIVAAFIAAAVLLSVAGVGVSTTSLGGALLVGVLQTTIFLGPWIYLAVSWRIGATLGMRILDLRVVDAGSEQQLGGGQVLLRLCGCWYSIVSLGIGFLWGLGRADRRGWTDLYAGTQVLHSPKRLAQWAPWPGYVPPWGATWGPSPPPPPPPPPAPVAAMEPPPPASRPAVRWTWSDVVPVLALMFPIAYGSSWLVVQVLRAQLRQMSHDIATLILDAISYGAMLGLLCIFVLARRRARWSDLGLHRTQWRWIGAWLPVAYIAFLSESITGLISNRLFPGTPPNQCVDIHGGYGSDIALALVGVAVIAPFVEELIFRGFLFSWLRAKLPLGWAILADAVLFSAAHSLYQQQTLFLPIFAAGVILATLYHYAGAIWPNVLVHVTFNVVGTLLIFTQGC